MERDPLARFPAAEIAAGCVAAWALVAIDAAHRDVWRGVSVWRHVLSAVALQTVPGVLVGAIGWGVASVERVVTRLLHGSVRVRVAFWGAAAALATTSVAFWAFSGRGAGSLAHVGPFLALAAAFVAGSAIARLAIAATSTRRLLVLASVAGLLAAFGLAIAWADLAVLVALYARLHAFVEAFAAALLALAAWLVLQRTTRSPRAARIVAAVAAVSLGWSIAFAVGRRLRMHVEDALSHAWREPEYVGRTLQWVELVSAFASDPRGFHSAERTAIARLVARWDLPTTTAARAWDEPRPPHQAASPCPGCSVVVFYVDTLRADAAHDPAIMPSFVAFERGALAFRDAYTTASDTVHALSAMTTGRYGLAPPHDHDLFAVARDAHVPTTLVIPESAFRYLATKAPWFRFDRTLRVPDFEKEDGVFGYGADQPSAPRLVDAALDRLARAEGPELLWMFHFDVHNWQKLDDDYLEATADRMHLPEDADLNWRYRAAASGVDAELARFLEGLERLGLEDRTVVVFVSDHGEALGIGGFWVHSVFVWQALVRVPLAIRIPGVAAKSVEDRVSLVDFLPTVAAIVAPTADLGAAHGEDLGAFASGPVTRRLPLLLLGADKDDPVRVGLLEPGSPFKVDLPLATGIPEMYDVRDAEPDEVDVAEQHPRELRRMLVDLARSPIFPR